MLVGGIKYRPYPVKAGSAPSGSAWAGEGFATLDGVAAVPMTSEHMGAIRGAAEFPPGVIIIDINPEVAPFYYLIPKTPIPPRLSCLLTALFVEEGPKNLRRRSLLTDIKLEPWG